MGGPEVLPIAELAGGIWRRWANDDRWCRYPCPVASLAATAPAAT
ncbi:hypothetical protein I552_1728 [Mycobacterium xenopi 3993]|nr:hypothetical protein I552_1728 [Mycobacterium xenopi 3993]